MSYLFLVILMLIEAALVSPQCLSGWTSYIHSDRCIRGFKERMTFIDAFDHCEKAGREGTLVSVHNAFQNAHLATIIRETDQTCQYWIGLYDFGGTNAYEWTDGSALDYQNWAAGNPLSNKEDTVAYVDPSDRNRWISTLALEELNCFICQQNVQMNPQTTPTTTTTLPSTEMSSLNTETTESSDMSTSSDIGLDCEDGWSKYNGYCYYFSSLAKPRDLAAADCLQRRYNSMIVSIHSEGENDFLWFSPSAYFWIGIRKDDLYNRWYWDDTTPYDYSKWASGQPSYAAYHECAYYDAKSTRKWTTDNCGISHNYICKYELLY